MDWPAVAIMVAALIVVGAVGCMAVDDGIEAAPIGGLIVFSQAVSFPRCLDIFLESSAASKAPSSQRAATRSLSD